MKRIVALQRHDTVELEVLLNLTNEFLRKDLAEAKRYSFAIVSVADTQAEAKWLSGAYNYLVAIHQQTGRLDSAKYFLSLTESLVKQNPDKIRMRYNYNQAAGLFYKNQGEFKQALPYLLENVKIWTTVDENKAGQLLNLGNLYLNMGDYEPAADYHLQSLRLFETLKNKRGQSFCLHSLGNDFFFMNQLASAKKYFEQSLQIKEQLGDKRGVLTTTISLGDVYKDMNDFKKSEAYYQTALISARDMKLPGEEARALHQAGLLYRRMNEIEKARESFSKSMVLFKQLGDNVSFVKTQSELRNIDQAEQNQKETETQMLGGLNTLIRTGDRQQEAIEYQRLSEYYSSNKNYEKALYYLKKHEALTDSVEGNTVLIQLKELEEKYNSEKKEREIAILKKDQELQALELSRQRGNTLIVAIILISVVIISFLLINRYRINNRAQRTIELERMRNSIARDLHDDIGSTLSSINIISQLALQEKNGNATHFQRIAQQSSGMMESMSDIVWSINPHNDSLEQVISKMKEFASEILDPMDVSYSFTGEENLLTVSLDAALRKNLFLIFKEAINNAAKYSGATSIRIDFKKKAHALHLAITDNGKGFDVTNGSSGNGLRNMKERAKNINGLLDIKSSAQSGTEVSLVLPIT